MEPKTKKRRSPAQDDVTKFLADVTDDEVLRNIGARNGLNPDTLSSASSGRLRMLVANRLRGLSRRGENVQDQDGVRHTLAVAPPAALTA